jgi:hypothetical protein
MSTALIAGVAPAQAPAKEKPLDRKEAIARAKTWTRKGVKYNQSGHKNGYRRDCSGFVSMAWDLPENLTTWRIPLVAKRISKKNLRPGDVMLDKTSSGGGRHVVMFEKWANKKKTKYWALESTGQRGVDKAVRRVVPYPYRVNKSRYKPYRYVGMDGYYRAMPKKQRQSVKGYDGRVVTPAQKEAAKRAEAKKKAEEKRAAEKKQEAEKKAAEAAAAEAKALAEEKARAEEAEQERRERGVFGALFDSLKLGLIAQN